MTTEDEFAVELADHAKIVATNTGYHQTPNRFTQALGGILVNGRPIPPLDEWVRIRNDAGVPPPGGETA